MNTTVQMQARVPWRTFASKMGGVVAGDNPLACISRAMRFSSGAIRAVGGMAGTPATTIKRADRHKIFV